MAANGVVRLASSAGHGRVEKPAGQRRAGEKEAQYGALSSSSSS